MMLPKKFYNALARDLNLKWVEMYVPALEGQFQYHAFRTVIDSLCEHFKRDNPNFHPDTFRAAVYDMTKEPCNDV